MYSGWAFVDVDGTLIDKDDNPRPHIRELFLGLKKLNLIVVVWSGGGKEYAANVIEDISSKIGWNLNPWIDEYRWKGTPIIWSHIRPVFFIDDSDFIKTEHTEDGSDVMKVPFYESTTMHNDSWLQRALHEAEKFYNQYGCGGHKKDSIV